MVDMVDTEKCFKQKLYGTLIKHSDVRDNNAHVNKFKVPMLMTVTFESHNSESI